MLFRTRSGDFRRDLADAGGTWESLDHLESRPITGTRLLRREFDVLHLNLLAPRGCAGLMASLAWPVKVLFVDHISDSPSEVSAPSVYRRMATRFLDRGSMLRIAAYAGVSNYVASRAAGRFGLPKSTVRTLYNGVDTECFRPDSSAGDDGLVKVVTVANLIPEKGIHHLLEAFGAIQLQTKNVQLSIVGDGPEEPRLREQAMTIENADQIEFLGLRDDVPKLLRKAEIFVHPAVWSEAFAYAPLEAMASGCAVIATRTGGTPEVIQDGQSGLLVPPSDTDALRRALETLIGDPELRSNISSAARRRTVEHFTLSRSVSQHLDCCEELASAVSAS